MPDPGWRLLLHQGLVHRARAALSAYRRMAPGSREDDCSENLGATERTGVLASETVTALKNFDWLVRDRGPGEVALAWDTGSLAFGDSAVLLEELTWPGFTPATGDEDGSHDRPR